MIGWSARRREPSLSRIISRQTHCSRRSVYLLDEHYYSPSDEEMDEFLALPHPEPTWTEDIHDCDDIAREFWTRSKTWFREKKRVNVSTGFLGRRATPSKKAHAFNFYVRRGNSQLIFIDRYQRVPLGGSAYLAIL